ncbi:MAG: HdeD family acid-resistance protein [Dichotomicrobium sp.]
MAEQVRSHIPSADPERLEHTIYENRTPLMLMGVALVLLGLVALVYPLTTAIVVKIMMGWILLIAGISEIIFSFSTTKWSEFFLELLVGLVFTIAGVWLAFFPLTGILTLTVLLALAFLARGVLEIISAFRMRPLDGWGWLLVAGIVGVLVGLFILVEFPSSAAWAIGLLVGVNLIASGIAYISLAYSAKQRGEGLSSA